MRKAISTLFLMLLLAGSVVAQETPRALQKLSDHVYAYVGTTNATPAGNSFGANCGVVVGEDAVLVVDTLISAKEAEKLNSDIKKITDKPVKYVVDTHYHLDHAWGNSFFTKEGAVIIGHANTRLFTSRSEYGLAHASEFGLTPQDMEGTALKFPTIVFKDNLRVELGGGVTVELTYPGPTHTAESIMAFVPGDNVLFTGDILFTRYHPNLGEGDIPSWQKALGNLEKTSAKTIVPGHGPLSSISDIKDMEVYLKEFNTKATQLCRGKHQEDAPAIARELLAQLPDQGRTELPMLVEMNLREKYLPAVTTTPNK